MSIENSYADSVRPLLTTRSNRVHRVLGLVGEIVNAHSVFDPGHPSKMLRVRPTHWREDKPNETAALELRDRDGGLIVPRNAAEVFDRAALVGSAVLVLDNGHDSGPLFTAEFQPLNVLGFDRAPLHISQLNGVVADLEQLQRALDARADGCSA